MPQTPHAYLLLWAQNRFNRFKQKDSGIPEAKFVNVATEILLYTNQTGQKGGQGLLSLSSSPSCSSGCSA